MTWHTHAAFALSSLWLLYLVNPGSVEHSMVTIVIGAALGSLLPDLDTPTAKLQRLAFSEAGIRPFALVSQAVRLTSRHRGWTHSPFGLLLAAILFLLGTIALGWEFWIAVVLGYGSHLVADALTPSGIPALNSYHSKKRLHLLPRNRAVVTGSLGEKLLFVLCATAFVFLLVMVLSSMAHGYP